MFGLAFVTSVTSLVSVSLKSFVTCSALLTKTWLMDGEVCITLLIKQQYWLSYSVYPFQLFPTILICITQQIIYNRGGILLTCNINFVLIHANCIVTSKNISFAVRLAITVSVTLKNINSNYLITYILTYLLRVDIVWTAKSISCAKMGSRVEVVIFTSVLAMFLVMTIASLSFNMFRDRVRFVA